MGPIDRNDEVACSDHGHPFTLKEGTMQLIDRSTTRLFRVILASLTVLALGACSSDGSDGEAAAAPDATASDSRAPAPSSGGGTATLTIGGETWEFTTVRCATGSDETKSDEWDFSLSAIENGLQLSVDRAADTGQYGDSIEIDDIKNFEDPSVKWSAPGIDPTRGPVDSQPFVEVDGKSVTAETTFTDGTNDDGTLGAPVPGTLQATCP